MKYNLGQVRSQLALDYKEGCKSIKMKTIYKYALLGTTSQNLTLPDGSKILSVKEQNDKIVLYALVDNQKPETENYSIIIYGTGQPIDDVFEYGYEFLDTVKVYEKLMFHVFYKLL